MAVNISPAQFKSGKLVEAVFTAIAKSGLAAHRPELEITESCLLERTSENLEILTDLKALGVSIALDDFGTDYCGLGYLGSFPFDKIKIDQCFVRDVDTTLAEGIETKEQGAFLRTLGCRQGQGFLFSPAIPADEIAAALKRETKLLRIAR